MEILEKIDKGRLAEIVASMGIEAEAVESPDCIRLPKEKGAVPLLIVTRGGSAVRLLTMVPYAEPDRGHVESWNARQRCARSYFIPNGGVGMDSDISLEGGVTAGNVREFIRNGIALTADWVEEVINRDFRKTILAGMAKLRAREDEE